MVEVLGEQGIPAFPDLDVHNNSFQLQRSPQYQPESGQLIVSEAEEPGIFQRLLVNSNVYSQCKQRHWEWFTDPGGYRRYQWTPYNQKCWAVSRRDSVNRPRVGNLCFRTILRWCAWSSDYACGPLSEKVKHLGSISYIITGLARFGEETGKKLPCQKSQLRWDGLKQKTVVCSSFSEVFYPWDKGSAWPVKMNEEERIKTSRKAEEGPFPPSLLLDSWQWETTAYIKEGACMLQDQLVGIRLVFTVGDIHLKLVCLKRTKTTKDKHPLGPSILVRVSIAMIKHHGQK